MTNKKIILASNSPRRKELLAGLGLPFEVHVMKDIDESYPSDLPVADVALYIAGKKANAYRATLSSDELVITADTVVIVGDEILGKPVDEADAERMLRLISGRTHQVTTGVCMLTKWIGYVGVTCLHGSYYNVMGLPVQRIYEALREL